jgi:hypothetical protein
MELRLSLKKSLNRCGVNKLSRYKYRCGVPQWDLKRPPPSEITGLTSTIVRSGVPENQTGRWGQRAIKRTAKFKPSLGDKVGRYSGEL